MASTLADPDYNKPERIDILLGVGKFVEVIHHGRQFATCPQPNTEFGWVLAGNICAQTDSMLISTHLTSADTEMTGDDLLRQFWYIEEKTVVNYNFMVEE